MKRKILVLAAAVIMMSSISGNAAVAFAKTVEMGVYTEDHDRKHEASNDRGYTFGGPGVTGAHQPGHNGYYGGSACNNNTLGYGTPSSGVNNGSTTYYTGSWQQDGNGWWYRFSNGTYPKNCWTVIDGSYYCFDANGYRRYGWINWNNKWYYCGTDGALMANTYTPDGYYVGSDGVWVR